MEYTGDIQKKLCNLRKKENDIFSAAKSNSADYMEALTLNPEDLEVFERSLGPIAYHPTLNELGSKGFLKFRATGEDFALVARKVYVSDFADEKFEMMVLAISLSSAEMNRPLGTGPALVNVVSDGWHKQIMRELTKDINKTFEDDTCQAPPVAPPPDIPKEIQHLW